MINVDKLRDNFNRRTTNQLKSDLLYWVRAWNWWKKELIWWQKRGEDSEICHQAIADNALTIQIIEETLTLKQKSPCD